LVAYRDHRYLLDDLLRDIDTGHNIVSTVFIECHTMYRSGGPEAMKPVGETEFVNGIAAMSASGLYGPTRVAAGIVGFADLTLGDAVTPVLEVHIAAGGGRFRGIRHAAGWVETDEVHNSHTNPPEGLLLDATFRQGYARLAPLGLTFEGWLYHPQIGDLIDLARAFPETTIILNHFGGPLGLGPYAGKRDEIFEHWTLDIAELATCQNAVAKLGGINMKLNGFGWHKREKPPTSVELAEATSRYYAYCIDHFGVERCMFESNFPVDKASCGYNMLWNTFKRIAGGCSPGEKASLFHDTATRVYRLGGAD
jgi:predicted TIM-barrel fold metal-dependent hydrolase